MCRPCLRGCTWQRCGLRLPSWIWGTRSHLGGLNSDFAMRCHASSQVMLEEFGVPRRFLGLTTVTYDGKVCLGQLEQVYVTVDGCTSKLFRLERFLCLVLKRCFRRASSFSSFSSTVCFFFFRWKFHAIRPRSNVAASESAPSAPAPSMPATAAPPEIRTDACDQKDGSTENDMVLCSGRLLIPNTCQLFLFGLVHSLLFTTQNRGWMIR